jgi:SAM-dependent methyltransferase
MDGDFSLEEAYGAYPLIEDDFEALLDVSLEPRGPDHLYDLVATLALPAGAHVLDVGCGEGDHSLQLAQRFDVEVTGVDPVARYHAATEDREARYPDLQERIAFRPGRAEALPLPDATVDLVWCRNALYHVAAIDRAGAEFRRVLRPGGRDLVEEVVAAAPRPPAAAAGAPPAPPPRPAAGPGPAGPPAHGEQRADDERE